MEKFRRLFVTKLDHYFIPFSAFYLVVEFLLFYLLHLIFLKAFFFLKIIFLFFLFSDLNKGELNVGSAPS